MDIISGDKAYLCGCCQKMVGKRDVIGIGSYKLVCVASFMTLKLWKRFNYIVEKTAFCFAYIISLSLASKHISKELKY